MLRREVALDLHQIRLEQRVIVGVCDYLETLRSDRVNFGGLVGKHIVSKTFANFS